MTALKIFSTTLVYFKVNRGYIMSTYYEHMTIVLFKEHALQELRDVTGRKVRKVNWARLSDCQMQIVEKNWWNS